MKVLFVCKSNIGRSQCAEEFFNKASKKHKAFSAGIADIQEGQEVIGDIEKAQSAVEDAKRHQLDISQKIRLQISKNLLAEADVVYALIEEKALPADLKKNPKLKVHPFPNKKYSPQNKRDAIILEIKSFAEDLAKSLDKEG